MWWSSSVVVFSLTDGKSPWSACISAFARGSKASFKFVLYTQSPEWGLRAAAAKYYRMFPQWFEKRFGKDGGWMCWGGTQSLPNTEELGFVYHWGPDARWTDPTGKLTDAEKVAAAVKHDNEIGVYSLPYIETTNMHLSMEGESAGDSPAILARLAKLADPEQSKALKFTYDYPYDPAAMGPDRLGWMNKVARAWQASLIFDRAGNVYGSADTSEFGLSAAKYVPCNPNPWIPGGLGELFLEQIIPAKEEFLRRSGARMDGISLDNFAVRGNTLDRRREHFQYATVPLTFSTGDCAPTR